MTGVRKQVNTSNDCAITVTCLERSQEVTSYLRHPLRLAAHACYLQVESNVNFPF